MANFEKRKVQLMENLMRTFGLNESKKATCTSFKRRNIFDTRQNR